MPSSKRFQFTHPGRGATDHLTDDLHSTHVSIHAPREGCDGVNGIPPILQGSFNSRTPGGVRLAPILDIVQSIPVSIHAPREGCDNHSRFFGRQATGFNSRTPGGVRLELR